MVRGASVWDREYLQDLCGELPWSRPSAPNPGGSPDDCQRCFGGVGSEGEIMSDQTRVSHPIYNLLPTEIEGFDSLAELALDMRWSWNHATDGARLIPYCGNSLKILGLSCRRLRATRSSTCWPILPSVRILTTCCEPSVRRRRRPHGFSKSIRKLP